MSVIIQPLRQVAPPLEQTLITHTQGLLEYNIPSSFGAEEGLHKICYVQTVSGYYFRDNM